MIFVSTMTYALGKELGLTEATAEFQRQLSDPDTESLPCVRAIARLRAYDEIGIWHDAAATCLGKARSRAFAAALAANPDVYITIDDDVEADSETLGHLIEAVVGQNNVVMAPAIARGSNLVNVSLAPDLEYRQLPSGGRTARVLAASFGLVAMSGDTMRYLAAQYPELSFKDEDGQTKSAVFFDQLLPEPDGSNSWLGEDVAFCRRAHMSGVRLEALCTGVTAHAGQVLKLETVADLPTLAQSPKVVR